MCPFFMFSKLQSLCTCYPGSLFCPSVQRTRNFCFNNFRDCIYFKLETSSSIESLQEKNDDISNKSGLNHDAGDRKVLLASHVQKMPLRTVKIAPPVTYLKFKNIKEPKNGGQENLYHTVRF